MGRDNCVFGRSLFFRLELRVYLAELVPVLGLETTLSTGMILFGTLMVPFALRVSPMVPMIRRFRTVVLAMPPPCYYEQTSMTMVTMLATVASIRLEANGSRSTLVTDRLARMMSNSRMSSSMTDPACLMARFGTAAAPVVPRLVMFPAPVTGAFPHRRRPFLCWRLPILRCSLTRPRLAAAT